MLRLGLRTLGHMSTSIFNWVFGSLVLAPEARDHKSGTPGLVVIEDASVTFGPCLIEQHFCVSKVKKLVYGLSKGDIILKYSGLCMITASGRYRILGLQHSHSDLAVSAKS